MGRGIGLAAVVAVLLVSLLRGASTANAALDLPLSGGLSLDPGSATIAGTPPPNADPGSDLGGFCWLQVFPVVEPGEVAFFEAYSDGSIKGKCLREEHGFGNIVGHMTGTASGTINALTGAFHIEAQSTTIYTGGFGFNPTLTRTLSGDGVLDETGSAIASFSYTFQRAGSPTDVAYGGSVDVYVSLNPDLPGDILIDHIEVVQVVQDDHNTVPLVAGKTTVARVFVRGTRTVQGVTVTLTSDRGGTPTLLPGGSNAAQADTDRSKKELSYNYALPPNWVTGGPLHLEAEVTGPQGLIESDTNNNNLDLTVTFQERAKLKIDYLTICVFPAPGQVCPDGAVANYPDLLNTMYPLPDNGVAYKRAATPSLDWPTNVRKSNYEQVLMRVRLRFDLQYLMDPTGVPDQLAAWAPTNTTGLLGVADAIWSGSGATGRATIDVMNPGDVPDSLITLSHEVGHNLGLRHTNTLDGCNATDPDSDWPFDQSNIHEIGWDVRTHVVVPETKYDMMSYCSPPADGMWVAPFTYKKLFESNSVPRTPAVERAAATYLVLSGSVLADGTSAMLETPVTIVSDAAVAPSNPAGNHCVRFNDSATNEYCFDVEFLDPESREAVDERWFSVIVPMPANVTKVALMKGATELAAIEKSGHAPTVQITSPVAGADWAGVQTLEWVGNDEDGDNLTYTVLHSADGGLTWIPILVDGTEPSFTFDANSLENGTNGVLKVIASDGLDQAEAMVGQLTIGPSRAWGDLRCTGAADAAGAVALKRVVAGIDDVAPVGCGTVGSFVTVAGMGDAVRWGDLQCDGIIDAADVLRLLRSAAGLGNSAPGAGCKEMGEASYVTF